MSLTLNASERKGVSYKSLISHKNSLHEPIGFYQLAVAAESHRLGKKGVVTRSALDPTLAIEPCGQTCLGCKGRDAPWPGETTMSDKQAILDAARATLERTANLPNLGNLPPPESRADRWRREADEAEAARLRERERLTDYEAAQPEARLAGMVAERSYLMEQLLPELLAAVFRRITAEVNEAVGQLRADVAVQRGVDRNEVVELPNVLRKQS